jgi:hypothetical protein
MLPLSSTPFSAAQLSAISVVVTLKFFPFLFQMLQFSSITSIAAEAFLVSFLFCYSFPHSDAAVAALLNSYLNCYSSHPFLSQLSLY